MINISDLFLLHMYIGHQSLYGVSTHKNKIKEIVRVDLYGEYTWKSLIQQWQSNICKWQILHNGDDIENDNHCFLKEEM